MTRTLIDDCFVHDRDRMRHEDAVALLRSRVSAIAPVETVDILQAAGRTLAAPITAPFDVPLHTNAAVDGYAFAASDYDDKLGSVFKILGRAAAGSPLAAVVEPGTAVRIFTGAVMPSGLDSVVMQEDVEVGENGSVRIPAGLKPGANVRASGEDITAGSTVLEAGSVLRPQDVACLAATGRNSISCFGALKVAIVSTGDEIISPGARDLVPGEVFDANAPMLTGLAALAGVNATHLGIWPDDRQKIEDRLRQAAEEYDVVLTSGGASKGEEDHMLAALDAIGKRHLWQLAVKPGRPMMFGQITTGGRDTVMVGLPGNPVAVFVCYLMYVFPLLRALGGAHWPEPRRFPLPAAFEIRKRKTGRREFLRGTTRRIDGTLQVEKFPRDGSGLISGLQAADGLIEVAEGIEQISTGDAVAFIPFSEFGISAD